ncbi:hypothetical protein AMJ44_07015 [candidate division WOR-1 bacterium DG_54_3]|uniref:Uncharacterized protein n=1 Tax=candidate division WOR-1 bacterium DG_54_3 TaxID=1703775 RepID=A0A0S7Y119_UNCSA|nr:MAG: hypothetical protein AMJ44_07015 [candidate division WOR-1 bacterium DG_54_3]
MAIYLLISGITSLIFGILFLIAPTGFWERIGNFFNKPVLFVESQLRAYNFAAGFIFLILGTWLIFLALEDSQIWFLYVIGAAFVIFGLLYIFTPNWLVRFSNLSGRVIITFDQIAIASRTSLGVVLILAAVYIFFKLFVALR